MSDIQGHGGLVVLAGAGAGGAELATAELRRWLARADAVVYDRLAAEGLAALGPPDAERIYVGKTPGEPSVSQEQINARLVELGSAGRLVVRLKGGDPLLFGRGGEEADALRAAGVAFRIVPGITAATAAAAYAGIPLTDRRLASSVALVTGHEDPTREESRLDFAALSGIDTLVFYMGVGRLEGLAAGLIDAGRAPETPAAMVERAATPAQRVLTGTLGDLPARAREAGIRPPALIIVGEVVSLRERLDWFDRLPLRGRTILVTRTRAQASELSERLGELGARVIEAPTIEIRPADDAAAIDPALLDAGRFDWIVLTSPNGAAALRERLRRLDLDARALAGTRIAAIGPGTASALEAFGLRADLVPRRHTTAALGEALAREGADGARCLLLRADIATGELPDALRDAGATVEQVAIYRTVRPEALPADAADALAAGEVDWITFTSSSTVTNFFALAGDADLAGVRLAAIGPVTAETLHAHDREASVIAEPHTIPGLVEAIRTAG